MSKLVPFSDLFDIPLRNGVTKPKKIRGEGYKMVNMGELFANPIIDNIQMDRVPLTETEKNSLLKPKDLLFARQSLIRSGAGQCSIFMDDAEDVCFESHIIRCRLHKDKANPLFYFYLFKSNYGREIMDPIIEQGAGASGIRGSDLSKLQVPYVELDKQNFIAEQLYDLDRKIQLNTQINQTLEQIAQTIFKSWFIDFDPVHAKANALASGQTAEQAIQAAMTVISGKNTQELHRLQTANPEQYQQLWEIAEAFPSGFDEEGVPRGWEEKPLPELIDFLEGPGIRNWQYTEEEDGIKFINIRCIKNGDLSLETANKITKEEAFGKYAHFQLKEDDIVISTSGTLGRFALVRNEHLPLCLNTSVIRFRPIENKSTLAFLLGLASNQLQYELEARASGSVQRNFGPTHLKQISVLLPDFYLLSLHNKYLSTLFELRKSNLRECDLLMKTRDVLLPKLLSGEV